MRILSTVKMAAIIALLLLSGSLLSITAQGSYYDDEDPSNDPNVCHTDPDPVNCDWDRGWFQAALNVGHITIQAAQTKYKDMHVNEWLPEEMRIERERQAQLLLDDDPTNDPNACHTSTDPNCDWHEGWVEAVLQLNKILRDLFGDKGTIELDFDTAKTVEGDGGTVVTSPCGTTVILFGLSAKLALQNPAAYFGDEDCDAGTVLETRWFCPEGKRPDWTQPTPNCLLDEDEDE